MLKVIDLEAIARVAKRRGILTAADNTFATPISAAASGTVF
jgi:cystathionine beta-lyase/cystathionine gamma-synthase